MNFLIVVVGVFVMPWLFGWFMSGMGADYKPKYDSII